MLDGEIYPVGTDIVAKYIGRDNAGYGLFEFNVDINSNGEYITNGVYSGSPVYLPVDIRFKYQKNEFRIYQLTCYDGNHNLIVRYNDYRYNNRTVQTLNPFPAGTAFIRFCTYNGQGSNRKIAITRIE